jgi:hypothetical protein
MMDTLFCSVVAMLASGLHRVLGASDDLAEVPAVLILWCSTGVVLLL